MPTTRKEQETSPKPVSLDDPKLHLNRELSFLQFKRRVPGEALDWRHPLLERVKFLSIFSSNLKEGDHAAGN